MKRALSALLSILLLLQCMEVVFAADAWNEQNNTDYDIWMADALIDGIDGGYSWYKTFRGLQEPVYRTLGSELVDDVPLVSISTTWTVFFNGEYRNQFANEQKYIYEIILMDYLKYVSSMDTSVKDLLGNEYKYAKKLYSTIISELKDNTIDYIDNDLSVKEAEKIWKNTKIADGINEAMKELNDGTKTVKKLIEELSQYLVLKETKDNTIALLVASKEAAGGNSDYIKAVDDIVDALNATGLEYVQGESLDYLWDEVLNVAWDLLKDANPFLKPFDLGIATLDLCFDSTKSASNNLKLVLLYTMDSYLSIGSMNATQTYLADKTPENARKFRDCFEAYIQFQMFGNQFASSWLEQYLESGDINNFINYTFEKENIITAEDLKKRCEIQNNGRNTILEGINSYSDIYQMKYPIVSSNNSNELQTENNNHNTPGVSVEEKLEEMFPAIFTYADRCAYYDEDYRTAVYNSEDFWSCIHGFVLANPQKDINEPYSVEELKNIAYCMFEGFDGNLPPYPDYLAHPQVGQGYANDTEVLFTGANFAEQELTYISYIENTDGSIDAIYAHRWAPWDPQETDHYYIFHLIPNSHMDINARNVLYYTITSVSHPLQSNPMENTSFGEQ